jgi:prepilin-type N-terminal cleavage/methylation domain-containing protein
MINRTSPPRAGFSLIEVLVVLAVAGLFFAMGSALLYGYLRLNNASAYQLDSLTTWRDMADAWKRDIHLAKAAPTPLKPNDNTAQTIDLPEGAVVWKWEAHSLVRQIDGAKNQKAWRLGTGKTWLEFSSSPSKQLQFLRHGDDKVDGRKLQAEYTARVGGDLP